MSCTFRRGNPTLLAPILIRAYAAEAISQFVSEYRRLLERREMAAALRFIPIDQIFVFALRPSSWRSIYFPREDAAANGYIEHGAGKSARDCSRIVPIGSAR